MDHSQMQDVVDFLLRVGVSLCAVAMLLAFFNLFYDRMQTVFFVIGISGASCIVMGIVISMWQL